MSSILIRAIFPRHVSLNSENTNGVPWELSLDSSVNVTFECLRGDEKAISIGEHRLEVKKAKKK